MNIRIYILLTIGVAFLAACSKTNYNEAGTAYGELNVYNASYTLDAYLTVNGRKVMIPLMPDSKAAVPLPGSTTPFFAAMDGFRQEYPDINWRNEIPWSEFDHYSPGAYTGSLHQQSVDSPSLFSFPVGIEKDKRYTWLLSDSLGVFHATSLTHEKGVSPGTVRLRLVQLCPDADSINLRIGNNLVTGLQNLPYRGVSGYVDYPLAADSLLKLRLFNAHDTLAVIARRDITAQPGQSYLLILKNYSKTHQYTGKDGKTVNVAANGLLDIRKIQ